ncbi:GNAT family N-acetyltransferase [Kitasatospora sp. NPDC003701]
MTSPLGVRIDSVRQRGTEGVPAPDTVRGPRVRDGNPAPLSDASLSQRHGHHPAKGLLGGAARQLTRPPIRVVTVRQAVAAAGCRRRPGRAAHLGVLTVPGRRGRGLARATGSAVVAHALAAGLLPHWRARVPASRRVVAALGFRELGEQFGVELAPPGEGHPDVRS